MKTIFLFSTIYCFFVASTAQGQNMTYPKLDKILHSQCDSVTGGDGGWRLSYKGRFIMLIVDKSHNRMRMISPITSRSELKDEHLENALIANFHSVLDAKYALSDDILWSAFIHPLKELTADQVTDALAQVYLAAESFGTTYQSTELVFPGATESPEPEKPTKKERSKL